MNTTIAAGQLIGRNIPDMTSNELYLVSVQVRKQTAEKWKGIDARTKSLLQCVISNLLKLECGINGTHSLDDVGLGGCTLYHSLPGLDCVFSGCVLQIFHAQSLKLSFH